MFSWRVRRQLLVVLFFLAVLGGVVFWGIKGFIPAPSCFDNRKNQGETGVDCGGPCEPCEISNPKPVNIFWAKAVPVRPNTYDVAAEVQNENEILASANLEYEFTLSDSFGVVAKKSGRTFIFPQEPAHVIEANLTTSRAPTSVSFKVLKVDWQLRRDLKPNLIVERREYSVRELNGLKQGIVEASVHNRTPFDFLESEINFIVLDQEGNLLGVNKIILDRFLSDTRRVVKSIWPEDLKGQVKAILVDPRVNIFEPGIILKPQ